MKIFYAYPSEPAHVSDIIESAAATLSRTDTKLHTWRENNIVGRILIDPIFENIAECDAFACDITKLNFNVAFECGFAIAKSKPILVTLNDGTTNSKRMLSAIGVFDTMGYKTYQNTDQLISFVLEVKNLKPFVTSFDKERLTPIYLVEYPSKSDALARIVSRIKKTHIRYRSFNPQEHIRLSAQSAIENVSASSGVIVPIASEDMTGADIHNIRAAFVAGISFGLGLPTLLLQSFGGPSPADIVDFVSTFKHPDQINDFIAEFGNQVIEEMQARHPVEPHSRAKLLALRVGDPMAENEMTTLSEYYLSTDEFERVLRAEANLVVGRKGTGKTALFTQVRDEIRAGKKNIVVDLKPEGYQLKKLREDIVDYITDGAQEHLFVAFWEYLLYLEVVYKLLEKDSKTFYRDPSITKGYESLSKLYDKSRSSGEGDFSERLLSLTESIAFDFSSKYGKPEEKRRLTQTEITELIRSDYLREIKTEVAAYLSHKTSLWILFDNLDKGWPAQGIDEIDTLILRSLIEAGKKIKRDLQRSGTTAQCVVFVRDDVYDILMKGTSDFGKEIRVTLDWTQREALTELILKRISVSPGAGFEASWRSYVTPLHEGEETFTYFLDRCLMRPRNLIKMIAHTRGYAINRRSDLIDSEAIDKGLIVYANDVLKEADQELTDVFPPARDMLYKFFGLPKFLSRAEVEDVIHDHGIEIDNVDQIIDHLLYFGFLGIKRPTSDPEYIYNFQYNMKLLYAYLNRHKAEIVYLLNPAFWPVLRVQ